MPAEAGAELNLTELNPADWPEWHIWQMARSNGARGGWCASRIAAQGRESHYLTEQELDRGLSMTLVGDDKVHLLAQLQRQAEIAASLMQST